MSMKETILEAGIALTCEGHAVMGRDDQAPAVRDEAVRGQRLDTPRGVAWHGQRLVASGGIPVRFATLQHEEDRSEDFMPKSDAGSFVAAPYGEGLELRLERQPGAAGGMREFAEQTAYVEIAFAYVPGLALARRLVVAGTGTHPRAQPVGVAGYPDLAVFEGSQPPGFQ